ncbi:MAG: sugar phosphate isomerase/epimerase [Gammaproteobacteria bacterium]|nr:sugar phosphate isomerase/epimerase [Gammaproteobacteria bacterium]
MDRRNFLKTSVFGAAGLSLLPGAGGARGSAGKNPLFRISLAQWSLHKTLFAGEMNNLEFPVISRNTFGIDAVEYVNTFMREKSRDPGYITELKNVCAGEGVRSVLIMCDGEGKIGDPDEAARIASVENHYRWVDIAAELGCHSIRVNASSEGDWNTQRDLAADGLRRLSEFAGGVGINVIVENHGGISSNGSWLAEVIRTVDLPRCGTLPDFGNFYMGKKEGWYDIYQGVEELMPFARGVSAKTHNFDESGNERDKDYLRLLRIVLDAGYRDYVGVEYEGVEVSEAEGIVLTRMLLERCRETLTREYP